MTAPTRQEIVAAFEAAEKAKGGPFFADPKEIMRQIADGMGLSYERVRGVMLDDWTARG